MPTSDGVVQPANRNMLEKAISWIYHGRYAFPFISSVNVHETISYHLYYVYDVTLSTIKRLSCDKYFAIDILQMHPTCPSYNASLLVVVAGHVGSFANNDSKSFNANHGTEHHTTQSK